MSDKKKPTASTEKASAETAAGVKKAISRAADLAALKIKLRCTIARRKDAYARLGELAYAKYRPRKNAVTDDIEAAIAATVKEITELSGEITEPTLRVEIWKAEAKMS